MYKKRKNKAEIDFTTDLFDGDKYLTYIEHIFDRR